MYVVGQRSTLSVHQCLGRCLTAIARRASHINVSRVFNFLRSPGQPATCKHFNFSHFATSWHDHQRLTNTFPPHFIFFLSCYKDLWLNYSRISTAIDPGLSWLFIFANPPELRPGAWGYLFLTFPMFRVICLSQKINCFCILSDFRLWIHRNHWVRHFNTRCYWYDVASIHWGRDNLELLYKDNFPKGSMDHLRIDFGKSDTLACER